MKNGARDSCSGGKSGDAVLRGEKGFMLPRGSHNNVSSRTHTGKWKGAGFKTLRGGGFPGWAGRKGLFRTRRSRERGLGVCVTSRVSKFGCFSMRLQVLGYSFGS